jgi:hypothetical protein
VIWLSKANLCCLVLCAPHIKPASFNIGLQKIKRRNIFGGWKIMKTRIHFWKPLSWKNNNFSKQNLSRRQRQLTNLERQYFPDWKFYSSKKVPKFLMGTNLLFQLPFLPTYLVHCALNERDNATWISQFRGFRFLQMNWKLKAKISNLKLL